MIGGSPTEAELLEAEEQARLANPELATLAQASQSAYENLDAAQAAQEDGAAFPALVDQPDGGPPRLPEGERIAGFLSPYAAQLDLGSSSYNGLIESVDPIAIETSPGKWSAIDLAPQAAEGGFRPTLGLVDARLPSRLGEGAQLPGVGLTVTPVDGSGTPLTGQGTLDGASVFYANTQTDTDTIVKPTTFGVALDASLRSERSPERLSYELALPAGAKLQAAGGDAGAAVDVVREGTVIARMPVPHAHDAAGHRLDVSVSVAGDVITLTVAHRPDAEVLPVALDPEFNSTTESMAPNNWHFLEAAGGGWESKITANDVYMSHSASYPKYDWAAFAMSTKGDSKIYQTTGTIALWQSYVYGDGWAEIEKAGVERSVSPTIWLSESGQQVTACAGGSCTPASGAEQNSARYEAETMRSSAEQTEPKSFLVMIYNVTNYISQPKETHSTVAFNTASEVDKTANVIGRKAWFGPNQGAIEYTAQDPGLGVSSIELERYVESKWALFSSKTFLGKNEVGEACIGMQCAANETEALTYETKRDSSATTMGSHLAEGYDTIRVSARDPMVGTASAQWQNDEVFLKVDAKPPHSLSFSGLKEEGGELVLGEVPARVSAQASDGEGSLVSAGIRSIELDVDGRQVGAPRGTCEPGPCSVGAEWTIDGSSLGAGGHTLTVEAIDNAGNVATREYPLSVYPASPVALGPGSVNPESGDFALEATDVSMSGGMGGLSVARHYDSLNTTQGAEGPLGPQWTIGLGSPATLEELPDGSVMLVGPQGLAHFTKTGSGFEAPPGDGNLELQAKGEEIELSGVKFIIKTSEYLLKDAKEGTTTRFTKPEGAKEWLATTSEGPVATNTTTDTYQTAEVEGKKIVEPKLEVAPHPNATCAYEKLERGCRALTFNYAEATTATGEGPTEWGDYKGNLTRVYMHAWDPVGKAMKSVEVAHYLYDSKGRLRVVWDPRISPALKVTYGYDAEGHVTAIDPPGQEPWLVHYGTSEGDTREGRALSVSRPKASLEPTVGPAPQNTSKPAISVSEPVTGETLSASEGSWSNSPLEYTYQWERCNGEWPLPSTCEPIPGMTNKTYMAVKADIGYALAVQVSASNAGGSTSVLTALSSPVAPPYWGVSFGTMGAGHGQLSLPAGTVLDGVGDMWIADTANNRVQELNSSGAFMREIGGLSKPEGIAVRGSEEWVADTGHAKVKAYNGEGSFLKELQTGRAWPDAIVDPAGVALGSYVYTSDWGDNTLNMWYYSGEPTSWYESVSELHGIAIGTKEDLWAAAGNGVWSNTGHRIAGVSKPYGVGVDKEDNVWVADTGNNRIQQDTNAAKLVQRFSKWEENRSLWECVRQLEWLINEGKKTEEEVINEYCRAYVGKGSVKTFGKPEDVTIDGKGKLFVTDTANDRIVEVRRGSVASQEPVPAAPATSNSVTTVEYGVPVSGEGAPWQLGAKEVEAWAQKDQPVYATAIFPPEEPVGWPAKDYKRASVYYMDSHARTVNVAGPNGAVATTEYDSEDEIVRALSAANRAKALEAGASSAEASGKLDTQSVYNAAGELLETKGPEHQVRLKNGETIQARNKVRYHYDEGAPEGEEYGLVTKTTDGAESAGKEYDVREATTGYAGQNELGFKLRSPTSTSVDPSGLNLVHTTIYDPTTGNVVETRSPAAGSAGDETSKLLSTFGGFEAGGTPLSAPQGVAVDAKGDLWIADTENSRVVEASATGEFMRAFGSAGSGNGQLSKPQGVAVDAEGHIWVADTANNRVEKFTATGQFMGQLTEFGTVNAKFEECVRTLLEWECERYYGIARYVAGTGKGAFKAPAGVTVDSKGNVYVVDTGNGRVQEASPLGGFIRQFGSEGTGNGQLKEPHGAAVDGKGDVWVADTGNLRAEELSPEGAYLRSVGVFYSYGVSIDAEAHVWLAGNMTVAVNGTLVAARVVELSQEGALLAHFGEEGSGNGQFKAPRGIVAVAEAKLWVADTGNNRIQQVKSTGEYVRQFNDRWQAKQLKFNRPTGAAVDSKGQIWIADTLNSRIQETTGEGAFVRMFGEEGSGNGQFDRPEGVAVDASGRLWVADTANNRVQELSSEGAFLNKFGVQGAANLQFKEPAGIASSGERVYVVDRGNARVQELSTAGAFVRAFGTEGEGKLSKPQGIAIDKEGHVWVTDSGTGRVIEYSSEGAYVGRFGGTGTGQGEFSEPVGIQITEAGNVWVADAGDGRVQELTSSGVFLQQLGHTSQFNQPAGMALNRSTGRLAVVNRGSATIELWQPGNANHEAEGSGGVHSISTIYYTATANTKHPECGEHPEWVQLPCETMPGAQPGTAGLPPLPVMRVEYNVYDQPEKTIETFGTASRTQSTSYDEAGRPLSATLTGAYGEPLPKITDRYDEKTGALVEQSSEQGSEVLKVKRTFNNLGQATSYIDAAGSQTGYSYDSYGRVSEVNYDVGKLDNMEAWQRYSYDETTGALAEIQDSAAQIFKASRDVEGRITSETYPDGLKESLAYNSIGEAVSQSYVKSECNTNCTWYEDKRTPSIHGESLLQETTLAKVVGAYDAAGRLTEVQETPAGEGCVTRLYAYDVESDRSSLTTRKPASEGKCSSEGGEIASHTYDQANRLTDGGIVYDGFGDITSLPASDAGGSAITSRFYVDGQLASQTQGEASHSYKLDPEGRTMLTSAYSKEVLTSTTVSHYAGASGTPSWTYNETAASWSRQIMGFDGLIAVQENAKEAVLQLSDLKGDVVETASLSATATGPLSKERSTEFGVPVSEKPIDTYKWLGSTGLSSAFPSSGAIAKDGATYIPQIDLPLQTTITPPPIPANKATPDVSTLGPGIAEGAAAAAARQAALYEEEQRKIHEAEAAAGNTPEPGDGGVSGGERGAEESAEVAGMVGDPLECKIRAWNPVEAQVHKVDVLVASGEYECKGKLYGAEFKVCLEDMTTGRALCETDKHLNGTKGKKKVVALCTFGHRYSTWVWLWEPPRGTKGISSWSKHETTCYNEALEEEEVPLEEI